MALERYHPAAILHVGIAGARAGSGVDVLDLVIGSEAIYEDLFTSQKLAPTSALPDASLLEAVVSTLPSAHVLPIGTTGRVGGTTGCQVESMEGFAVLRAAALAGAPAVEVRAISNVVDAERSAWRLNEAVQVLHDALPGLLAAVAK